MRIFNSNLDLAVDEIYANTSFNDGLYREDIEDIENLTEDIAQNICPICGGLNCKALFNGKDCGGANND
ncbi:MULTISPECIES: hypothetical protein [Cysteiniphilum]|uniref:Uncharacterized protein n=1 Tax=Cysteiniphilum litorale TaxID=2056700 RepID=A0A8J2Z791_9GAMM|nr:MULTISPECIES: hypothetical protein [Cysteiniphilum]GGG08953.1 hypothetical protein GCM10010995_28180 [Cysteiniphilum litorale]